MKRLLLLTIAIGSLLVITSAQAQAQDYFTFNVGNEVHSLTLDNCYGKRAPVPKCTSGSGPAGTITLGEANSFTLSIPQTKVVYTGTYVETSALRKESGLMTASYAVDEWKNGAQNRALRRVRAEVKWRSYHRGFLQSFTTTEGKQSKLYVTTEAEAMIKKLGFKLELAPFQLVIPASNYVISHTRYSPTVILEAGKNFLQMRWIDENGREAVIAIRKDGTSELIASTE